MSHLFRDYRFGSEIDSSEGRSVASSLIAPNSDRPSIQDNAYYEPLTSSLLAKKNQLDSREHKEDPSKKTKTKSISRKVPKNFVDSNDSERGTQYHTSNSSQSVNTSHASYSQNTFEHNSQSNTDRARRFSGLIRLSAAHIALKRSDKEEQSQHALYNIFRALSTIASRVMNCRVSEPMDTRMSVDEFISLSEYLKTMKPFSISDEQQQLGQNQPIPETIHSDSLETNQYTTSEFSKKRRKFGSLGYMFSFAPSRHITSKYSDTEDEEESNDTDNLLSPPSASDHDATDFRSSSNIFYFMCHAFQFVKNYVQPVKDNYIQIQFQGWSLFLFSPTSQIRLMLWKIIGSKQFEVFVFVLLLCQWAILSLVPIRFSAKEPFFSYPVDYLLFIINSVFTFELLSKIVVYGFCLNKHSLKKPTLSSIFGRVVNVLGMSLAERESTIKYRRLSIQSQDSDKSDTTSIHYLRQRLPAFAANPQSRSTSFSSASNISHRQNRIQDDGSDCLTNGSSQLIESFKRRPRNGNGRKQEDINTNLAAAKYQILASLKPTLGNDSSTVQTLEVTHKVFLSSIANIIDLISIGSYWVDVAMLLCFHQLPWSVFQACACIRIFRLLVLTEGTSVIMESIFSSLDMLKNVMGFFVFFWILFSLAALGLFMNAFSRQCAVLPLTQNQTIQYVEPRISCSGYILNESQERTGVFDLESKTQFAYMGADGHYCHFGQICVQDSINQPEHGYMSFDNIFYAMLNMFTIISTENWTDLLYITQNSISTIGAAAFYSVCIYLMTFILVPMFIAVITTSFSRSRGDMRQSAFSSREKASKKAFLSSKKSRKEPNRMLSNEEEEEEEIEEWVYDESADLNNRAAHTILKRMSRLKNLTYTMIYHARFKYFWSIMVLINMIAMSFFQSSFSIEHKQLLDLSNRIFNIMFVLEILMRVYGSLGWKQFWYRKFTNKTDFVLMLGTILGEFSFIKSSKYHHLFVLFAILRSYRIAYLFPGVLQLISDVVGEGQGIINLTFFTFLVLFLLSPLSVQLFGGDFTFVDENEPSMRFDNFYQAFLSVFQIMTGENWTDILYDAMYSQEYASITYAAVFVTFLYFAVHYLVLNLFVAVIMENFDLEEEEIKKIQIKKYIRERQWKPEYFKLDRITRFLLPFSIMQDEKKLKLKNIPQSLVARVTSYKFKEFFVQENYSGEDEDESLVSYCEHVSLPRRLLNLLTFKSNYSLYHQYRPSSISSSRSSVASSRRTSIFSQHSTHYSVYNGHHQVLPGYFTSDFEEEEMPVKYGDEYEVNVAKENKAVIIENLNLFRSMMVLGNDSTLRKLCTRLVGSRNYKKLIIALICVSSILALWADESSRLRYPQLISTCIEPVHAVLLAFYLTNALIHMVADGIFILPKSYLRKIWNILDVLGLLTQVVLTLLNLITNSTEESKHYTSYLRVLRTIRLLRIMYHFENMRVIFLDLLYGLPKMVDVVTLNLLVFIPFAIYGYYLFSGRFLQCNDANMGSRQVCLGEFKSSDGDTNDILLPRVWRNPYDYSFDTFGKSLLHLFECASGEGWIRSLFTAMSIDANSNDIQPRFNWSSTAIFSSLYYVVFMFVASLCSIQLFIGVFLEIFKQRNGIASLTNTQRQFQDLQRQLSLIKPSRRAYRPPDGTLRATLYDLVIDKRGKFARFMAGVIMANVVVFATEHVNQPLWLTKFQTVSSGVFVCLYIFEIVTKILGLGFSKWISASWNIYDFALVSLVLLTYISKLYIQNDSSFKLGLELSSKLFSVGIAFRLAQRIESLDTLFKSIKRAAPSIFSVTSVFGIVMICFGVIFQENFSSTRYGPYGNEHANFRSLFNTMLTLFRITTGEDWDALMHDFFVLSPSCVGKDDCGSPMYAVVLFSIFYVICTYIFVNLFTMIVIDNFSFTFDKRNQFTLITRSDLRSFKTAWSILDPSATGFINIDQVPQFLNCLNGIFSIQVYDKEHSINALLDVANQIDINPAHLVTIPRSDAYVPDGNNINSERNFNLYELNQRLSTIDPQAIKERKQKYTEVYQEIINSASRKGIAFQDMLRILALQLVDVSKSLTFDELVHRAKVRDKIAKQLAMEKARGLVTMIVKRREFLKLHQKEKNLMSHQNHHGRDSIAIVGKWLKLPHVDRKVASPIKKPPSIMRPIQQSNENYQTNSNESSVPKIVVQNFDGKSDDDLTNVCSSFDNQQNASKLFEQSSAEWYPKTNASETFLRRSSSASTINKAPENSMLQNWPRRNSTNSAQFIRKAHSMPSILMSMGAETIYNQVLSSDIHLSTDEDAFTKCYSLDDIAKDMNEQMANEIMCKFQSSIWSDMLVELE